MAKLTESEENQLLYLLEQEELDQSRYSHLKFMQHTWMKGAANPFLVGFHTRGTCAEIDQAFENYRNGISTYLLISMHHRSGKSDMSSRYLGPHFLGEFPDGEVMQVSYQAALAQKFAADGRNIFRSEKFNQLYPNIGLSKESNAKGYWEIVDNKNNVTGGKLYSSGLTSGLTGSGWHLGILDDYCAGRKEAESIVQRDSAWDAFTNDFMTRAAPVCICIITATPWHWDDLNGRIQNQMKTDPNFPKFKIIAYPAKAEDYKGPGHYPGKYLFSERYSDTWYKEQYAILGRYAAAALLDCNPVIREGGVISVDNICWEDGTGWPSDTRVQWARIWDLAHTAKQRSGDDPDYTSGTRMAFEDRPGDPVPHLYISHVARCRKGPVARDKFIKMHADKDSKYTKHAIENSLDAKDAYEYIKTALPDVSWSKIMLEGDKLVRATPLLPIFEAPGHVHVMRGDWNDDWLDELIRFDGTGNGHDDQIDNLSGGYIFLHGDGSIKMSDKNAAALRARRLRGR